MPAAGGQQGRGAKGNLKSSTCRYEKIFQMLKTWTAAWNEARMQEHEEKKKYRAERAACGSGQWSPPSRADLGISLPEGMRVDMVGRIN